MYTTLFFVFLAIFSAGFVLEQWLGYLNFTRAGSELPPSVSDIYDAEEYQRQQDYFRENYRFSLWSGGFNFLLVLAMLLFFGFALVNGWAASVSTHPVAWGLLFFGILLLAADLLNIPFSIYDTFVIEEKYGFNTTTAKTFLLDKLKTLALGAILGGGIMALIIWIFEETGDLFWMIAWGVMAAFSIFITMFYSSLIVPLFNKQTPLEEGDLRTAIENFAAKTGFKLHDIYIIDGSKRSTKANAYFTGLGAKKRIVLYDTLVKEMTIAEVVAVLAHEIGHYKKHHVELGLALGLLQTALLLYLFSLVADSQALSRALGVDEPNFHIGMVAFGILYSPVSLVTGLAGNIISRMNEYQADRFAAVEFDAESMSSALRKLSAKNLSNLTPHPLYVFFNYSHPTLVQRLENINRYKKA